MACACKHAKRVLCTPHAIKPAWIFRLCVVKQADWNVITTVKNNGFVVAIDEYLRTDAVHTIQDRQQLQYGSPDLVW